MNITTYTKECVYSYIKSINMIYDRGRYLEGFGN